MQGADVAEWQGDLVAEFSKWGVDYPLEVDGDYGQATRSATASFMRAWGVENAQDALQDGLTPWWRTKLRLDRRTVEEQQTFESDERVDYRRALRDRYANKDVCTPIANILGDSWGYHPPVHDGVDLICNPKAPLLAICTGRVIRADAGGWWGKGAPSDPALRAKGDGIIIVRCAVDVGPFKPGLNFCYGHAEGAVVSAGDKVHAGQRIGDAGFANAWHAHFMVNDNANDRGVGDRDPLPYVNYARAHS